jgi:hypothetical protein
MPSGTFVIHRIVQLPVGMTSLKTKPRSPMASHDPLADPVYTSVRFTEQRTSCGYELAKVHHRQGIRIHGLWRGNPVAEVIRETDFNAFYSRSKRFFISNAERDLAEAAVSRLSKDLPRKSRGQFRLEKVQINFEPLLRKATNVVAAWFRRKNGAPIHSQAAFGDKIRSDSEYAHMARRGDLRNLPLVLPFNKRKIKLGVSSSGSLHFMKKYDYPVYLGVVEHLDKIHAIC